MYKSDLERNKIWIQSLKMDMTTRILNRYNKGVINSVNTMWGGFTYRRECVIKTDSFRMEVYTTKSGKVVIGIPLNCLHIINRTIDVTFSERNLSQAIKYFLNEVHPEMPTGDIGEYMSNHNKFYESKYWKEVQDTFSRNEVVETVGTLEEIQYPTYRRDVLPLLVMDFKNGDMSYIGDLYSTSNKGRKIIQIKEYSDDDMPKIMRCIPWKFATLRGTGFDGNPKVFYLDY